MITRSEKGMITQIRRLQELRRKAEPGSREWSELNLQISTLFWAMDNTYDAEMWIDSVRRSSDRG